MGAPSTGKDGHLSAQRGVTRIPLATILNTRETWLGPYQCQADAFVYLHGEGAQCALELALDQGPTSTVESQETLGNQLTFHRSVMTIQPGQSLLVGGLVRSFWVRVAGGDGLFLGSSARAWVAPGALDVARLATPEVVLLHGEGIAASQEAQRRGADTRSATAAATAVVTVAAPQTLLYPHDLFPVGLLRRYRRLSLELDVKSKTRPTTQDQRVALLTLALGRQALASVGSTLQSTGVTTELRVSLDFGDPLAFCRELYNDVVGATCGTVEQLAAGSESWVYPRWVLDDGEPRRGATSVRVIPSLIALPYDGAGDDYCAIAFPVDADHGRYAISGVQTGGPELVAGSGDAMDACYDNAIVNLGALASSWFTQVVDFSGLRSGYFAFKTSAASTLRHLTIRKA